MFNGPRRSADELARLAHLASSHGGPWPRISVWHGALDQMVKPRNAEAIVEQWARLHSLQTTPASVSVTPSHRHRHWSNAQGEIIVEEYLVAEMGHGVPIATGSGGVGAPGPYFLHVGLGSSERIATSSFAGSTVPRPFEVYVIATSFGCRVIAASNCRLRGCRKRQRRNRPRHSTDTACFWALPLLN